MGKEKKLSGFTLSMALMDTLPALFFSVSIGVLSARFDSVLFSFGDILVICAGAMKVLWKVLLATVKKNILFFNRQMRFVMLSGFVLMIAALAVDQDAWSLRAVLEQVCSLPSIAFFVLAVAGMGAMIYFARHFAQTDARSNWTEQGINALTQFFLMMGILT